ncbi:flippase [Winogradskyella echinorum]|uniref:Flippase n=1 Tax=Winogradskyella echinorum TaxID=538189 RepID=A0ABR6XZ20_9FLAO|nr:flippase [Winogradskyella echinorum]MBC3845740.1 flippase [Winogradskyella echinorum]MBC5750088.1 flippase [Winogradskyella echinorum]
MLFKTNKETNFNELLKGSSISFLLKLVGMLFGYMAMLFVTNNFGAETWGLHSLCFTILGILTLIPKFGFDNSLVRIITELNINKSKEIYNVLKKVIIISLVTSITVILVTLIFSDYLVEHLIKSNEIKPLVKIICFAIIPTVVLTIISGYFQAIKNITKHVLFQTTAVNILFFILLVTFYVLKIAMPVFKVYFISIAITSIFSVIYFINTLRHKSLINNRSKKAEIYSFKRIISISSPMLLSTSFALLMGWSDVIIISFYNTTSEIGIYDSALKLSTLSGIFLIAVNSIATPKFVEFFSNKDFDGLKETVQKSTKLIFYTTTPILLILVLFSSRILSYFGEEFVAGSFALIVLCISRFVNAISGSVGYIMQMTDQQKTYQNVIIIAFFINLILNLVLIPLYGINGAAIASSTAMIFWNITLVFIIKMKLGFWTIITFKL